MATYMNQTNSGRIIVQQTSPSAIIVQPDNERKIILKGSGGLKGETGDAATITVGSTTTGEPGTSASVVNSGTSSDAVLDFVIPKGSKGDKGDTGATGATGPANTLSIGTVQKGDTAEATITGAAPNQTLNLTLPKGDKGDTGSQGPAGQGVITGGSTGQVLTKKSGTDYDTEWTTPATYSDFTGATSSVAGAHGLVPAPTTSDPDKFLKGDGTWGTPPGATYTGGTGIDITGNVVSVDNTVATKTDLPTKTSDLINDGSDNTSTYVEADELATVATSGSYSDLLNKPTIPTVNDATLTIQKNGTTVETFTANSSTNKTANITVPTKTSDITNDGADGTSTYVEATDLNPGDVSGEGTSITLPGTQGGRFSDVELKGSTEQATYSGKNLLNEAGIEQITRSGITVTYNAANSTITINGTATARADFSLPSLPTTEANVLYAFSYWYISGSGTCELHYQDGSHSWQGYNIDNASTSNRGFSRSFDTSMTFDTKILRVKSGTTCSNLTFHLQFEKSSTVTPYEPYVGGAPSPSPSYPQTVQTVTGEQTIAINDGDQQSQTYTINLGTTELCKIGDYQDYIYKNNGTWYLHKATDKITDNGTKDYQARTNTSATHSKFYVSTDDLLNYPIAGTTTLVSDHFIANIGANEAAYSGSASCGSTASGYTKRLWYSVPNSIATTPAAFKTWIAANPVTTYYAMATPIDTPITGTLLDDLNALDQATSYNGNTYITVSSVSPDLPATLSVAVEQESALPVATETSVGVVSVGDGLSITDGGVLSVDNSKKEVYSTEEQVVGTWIDGKPVYRVVLSGNISSTTGTYVPTNAYNAATIDVISCTGKLVNDQNQYMQLGCYLNSSNYSGWFMSASAMTIFFPSAYNHGAYTIVIEYTKKTS